MSLLLPTCIIGFVIIPVATFLTITAGTFAFYRARTRALSLAR